MTIFVTQSMKGFQACTDRHPRVWPDGICRGHPLIEKMRLIRNCVLCVSDMSSLAEQICLVALGSTRASRLGTNSSLSQSESAECINGGQMTPAASTLSQDPGG